NKFKIFVSYVETKYTIKSREEIYNLFSPYCDEVLILAAWNLGGYNPEVRTELSTPQMDVDYDSSRTVPCPVPFNAVTITANGFLTGCCVECQDYLAVADLSKNTLLQAWECRTFSEYRNRHINKDISNLACMNCIYNSQIVPQPLNKDLCASFDAGKMFNPEVVKSRINKYLEAETEE
ncbi:MAG: SPASM domain-containing protein, partial [Lachnospiraceae bacterium]|nr:SPASM domain-containing protein [Lachnospiraceae bacterium]